MADLLTAITHYCNYQERCHKQVRNKLYELGADKQEVDTYLSKMIEINLLNEQRYAEAFARGHFNNKSWGKVKITQYLKSNGISEYCINKAIQQIELSDYNSRLEKIALKKWESLKKETTQMRVMKIKRFLLQKGFEYSHIEKAIVFISENEK